MLPKEFVNIEETEDRAIVDKRQMLYGHTIREELLKEFINVAERTHNFTVMEVFEGKWANRNLRRRITLEHCRLQSPLPDFDEPEFCIADVCKKLHILSLTNNKIIGRFPSFHSFYHLHTLNLSFNQLHGPIPDMSMCAQPKYCYLNNNKLDGTPPSFKACTRLKELWLHCNCLSGVQEWKEDPDTRD